MGGGAGLRVRLGKHHRRMVFWTSRSGAAGLAAHSPYHAERLARSAALKHHIQRPTCDKSADIVRSNMGDKFAAIIMPISRINHFFIMEA